MNSAKTLNLLAVAHNYKSQGKKIFLIKPSFDTRFGLDLISSRAGIEAKADLLLNEDSHIDYELLNDVSCILVDEIHFIKAFQIEELRKITIELNIPVICYGLRADFRSNLFEGSKRLLELADTIEEIKTTCHFCNKKAIMNMRHINGKATATGPSLLLGSEDKYYSACFSCYLEQLNNAGESWEL